MQPLFSARLRFGYTTLSIIALGLYATISGAYLGAAMVYQWIFGTQQALSLHEFTQEVAWVEHHHPAPSELALSPQNALAAFQAHDQIYTADHFLVYGVHFVAALLGLGLMIYRHRKISRPAASSAIPD